MAKDKSFLSQVGEAIKEGVTKTYSSIFDGVPEPRQQQQQKITPEYFSTPFTRKDTQPTFNFNMPTVEDIGGFTQNLIGKTGQLLQSYSNFEQPKRSNTQLGLELLTTPMNIPSLATTYFKPQLESFIKSEAGEKGRFLSNLSTSQGREDIFNSFEQALSQKPTLDTLDTPAADTTFSMMDIAPGAGLLMGGLVDVSKARKAKKAANIFEEVEDLSKPSLLSQVSDLFKKAKQNIKNPFSVFSGEESAKALETEFRSLPRDARMNYLMNYPKMLASKGYSKNQVNKIGVKEAYKIIKNNILPTQHYSYSDDVIGQLKSTTLNTDIDTVRRAEAIGAMTEGKFKGLSDDMKDAFRTWVNNRQASKIEGFFKAQEFKSLDDEGLQGVINFQQGLTGGKYKQLKKYFDKKFRQAKDAGLDINYRDNYITQLWDNPKKEVQEVFRRLSGEKPGFTLKRLFNDYVEGINQGLSPRVEKLSDIVNFYEARVNKVVADRAFFNKLANDGIIQPAVRVGHGWKTLDPDLFPRFKVKTETGVFDGDFAAPEEVADIINNYLQQPDGVMSQIANYTSALKNLVLSAGVPKTSINFHGFNTMVRDVLSSKNPIQTFTRDLKYMAKPGKATEDILKNSEMAKLGAKHGLTFSVEDYKSADELFKSEAVKGIKGKLNKAYNKYTDFTDEFIEKPLFQQVIPAMKVSRFEQVFNDLKQSGMSQKDAARTAADTVNNFFGGINHEQIGRSREMRDFLRATILAPDWAETNLKLPVEMVKSLINPKSPEGQIYRRATKNLVLMYSTASLINKIASGHWMHENDSGHTFELELGSTIDGKKRFFRPFGTAADFVRLPNDIIASLAQGDPSTLFRTVRNRLSIPAGVAIGLLANVDYKGQALYGKDKYGRPIPPIQQAGNVAGELLSLATPAYVQGGIDFLTGNIGFEELLAQTIEFPARYQSVGSQKYHVKQQIKQAIINDDQVKYKSLLDDASRLKLDITGIAKEALKQKSTIQENRKIPLYQSKDPKEQKNFFSKLFSDITTKRAINSTKDTIKSGDIVSDDTELPVLQAAMGLDEIVTMPESSSYQKAKKADKAFNKIDDILEAEYLNDEQKTQLVGSLGLSRQEADYYQIARQDIDIKTAYIKDQIPQFRNGDELMNFLAVNRIRLNDKILASDGVIDNLREQGLLTYAEAKTLKNIDFNNQGELIQKTSSKSKSGKSKKIKSPKFDIPQFESKISIPKADTVSLPKSGLNTSLDSLSIEDIMKLPIGGRKPTRTNAPTAQEVESQLLRQIL